MNNYNPVQILMMRVHAMEATIAALEKLPNPHADNLLADFNARLNAFIGTATNIPEIVQRLETIKNRTIVLLGQHPLGDLDAPASAGIDWGNSVSHVVSPYTRDVINAGNVQPIIEPRSAAVIAGELARLAAFTIRPIDSDVAARIEWTDVSTAEGQTAIAEKAASIHHYSPESYDRMKRLRHELFKAMAAEGNLSISPDEE
jgi:hypothetical protein